MSATTKTTIMKANLRKKTPLMVTTTATRFCQQPRVPKPENPKILTLNHDHEDDDDDGGCGGTAAAPAMVMASLTMVIVAIVVMTMVVISTTCVMADDTRYW